MGAPAANAHALHAALSPAPLLVDDRRTLYRLAVDLFAPGTELSDNLADLPLVRYEIGRALAGQGDLDPERLFAVAAMRVHDAEVPLVADPSAAEQLEALLRIVAAPDTAPRPLTEADGQRFEKAREIVAEGVILFRRTAPEMAEDLLAHVAQVAVLNRDTSGGVISASSRYVPGLVLIDEPVAPIEVAEALVHEGAHEKFFDLAITREFLDARAEDVEPFTPSWSRGVRWPLEQVYAAWHAYSCLAQFSRLSDADELGPVSLLPVAEERASEIGRWLLDHESDLRTDARWLLRAMRGEPDMQNDVDRGTLGPEFTKLDQFQLRPDVRFRQALSGRVVAGRAVQPPDLYWLSHDASEIVARFPNNSSPITYSVILAQAADQWQVDSSAAARRLSLALGSLVRTQVLGHEPTPQPR